MSKILPHSTEAEESIISSCLLGGYKEPCATLEPSDFYKTAHQKIFISIQSLASTNKPIDLITVIDALTQKKELEDCGGAAKRWIVPTENGPQKLLVPCCRSPRAGRPNCSLPGTGLRPL